jgi:hypothetical protein
VDAQRGCLQRGQAHTAATVTFDRFVRAIQRNMTSPLCGSEILAYLYAPAPAADDGCAYPSFDEAEFEFLVAVYRSMEEWSRAREWLQSRADTRNEFSPLLRSFGIPLFALTAVHDLSMIALHRVNALDKQAQASHESAATATTRSQSAATTTAHGCSVRKRAAVHRVGLFCERVGVRLHAKAAAATASDSASADGRDLDYLVEIAQLKKLQIQPHHRIAPCAPQSSWIHSPAYDWWRTGTALDEATVFDYAAGLYWLVRSRSGGGNNARSGGVLVSPRSIVRHDPQHIQHLAYELEVQRREAAWIFAVNALNSQRRGVGFEAFAHVIHRAILQLEPQVKSPSLRPVK